MSCHSILRRGIAAAGLALGVSTQAAAVPLQRPVTVKATGAQMLRVAEDFIRRGQQDRAERILQLLANDPNPDIRNEARFKLAAMASKAGNYSNAAVLLRRILDEKPGASRVRLELAGLLQKMGDQDSALRELRALRAGDLPPNVARFVDRLALNLQANKPLGFHLELAIAPDSNVNRATRSDTLGTVFGDFTIDQKVKSGIGGSIKGLAQARIPIGGDMQLLARATGDANIYRDSDFDDITLDFAAGPQFRLGRHRLSAEMGLGQQWYGMKPSQRTLRLAGSVTRPLGPVSQLRLDVAGRKTNNMLNDLQDGRGIGARILYERAISPELLLSVSVGADRYKARDDAYSTRTWNLGLNAYRELGRATLNAGIEFGRLKADERLSLLPRARDDKLLRFQFGAVFRQLTIGGFAPTTRLVIERNKSSVEFYDYKRRRVEFGVSRAF